MYCMYCMTSYLNPFEYKDEEIEKKFFESNPHLGIYYNKIIGT